MYDYLYKVKLSGFATKEGTTMALSGMSVGIIGGSIAGCAAAIALGRAGMSVEVFERSATGLMDRGSGIGIPGPLRSELMARGYLAEDFPSVEMKKRWWQFPDGTPEGRQLWTQTTPAFANNWGNLWQALRKNVPDDIYHDGKKLVGFETAADGVSVAFEDGTTRNFDLLVGADGYHSLVRKSLHPTVAPEYAGYVLWRGNYPERDVPDRQMIEAMDAEGAWLTVPFEGGHGVLYMIPDFDGSTTPGHRRVNWAIYAPCPEAQPLDGVNSVPPGGVTEAAYEAFKTLLAERFPPAIRDLVGRSAHEDVSMQPIYDSIVDTYVGPRTLLIGDAGTMTRPHTATGATKALEDALALEDLTQDESDLAEVLRRYDERRCDTAKTVSEIGRRIGQAQVTATPDWAAMSGADFEAWHKAILSGDRLYLYDEAG